MRYIGSILVNDFKVNKSVKSWYYIENFIKLKIKVIFTYILLSNFQSKQQNENTFGSTRCTSSPAHS